MEYTNDDLAQYIPKAGSGFAQCTREIISFEIDVSKKLYEETADTAKLLPFTVKDRTSHNILNAMYEAYVSTIVAKDSRPKWALPEAQSQFPAEVASIGRWIKYKMKALLYLKHRGNIPWESL
jgi:hypothetical protein